MTSESEKRRWGEGRTVPPWEPGLVTHTPAGTIIEHGGSGNSYTHWGCRCRDCKQANNDRVTRRRKERELATKNSGVPDGVIHGKSTTYVNWGCRCEPCTEAQSIQSKSYYSRHLSAEARRKSQHGSWDSGYDAKASGKSKKENPHK